MADIAIKIEDLGKSFKLPHEKHSSIKGAFVNIFNKKKGYEKQEALKDISFDVKKGEFFGIVGRNGSGKSTLLKLIAGIYSPDKGNIAVNGKLTPFIELGVGFNMELTGRENVFLNGALLGFSRSEMQAMYGEIVRFAELGKFMDQKLKNYSSGMQVRLAFSIAIRAKTEILVIDEVLAVGDVAFQKKCYAVFQALKREGRTVVFVTHGMGDVERFCDRVLVVDKGKQLGVFEAHEARILYEKINQQELGSELDDSGKGEARWGSGPVRVESVSLINGGKSVHKKIDINQPFEVDLRFKQTKKSSEYDKNFLLGINIFSDDGHNLFGPNTSEMTLPLDIKGLKLTIPNLPLNKGRYYITVALFDPKGIETYDHLDRTVSFEIDTDNKYYGSLDVDHSWAVLG